MYNPESVQENETHKILWDFDIQADHLILARQTYLVIANNKKEPAKTKRKGKER